MNSLWEKDEVTIDTPSCSWKFIKLFNNNECVCVRVCLYEFSFWHLVQLKNHEDSTEIYTYAAGECTSLPSIPFEPEYFREYCRKSENILQYCSNTKRVKNRSEIPVKRAIKYRISRIYEAFAWMVVVLFLLLSTKREKNYCENSLKLI